VPTFPVSESSSSLALEVLLFASLKDAAGGDRIVVQVPPGATVNALLEACGRQHPALAPWLRHIRVAVNCEYVEASQVLAAGDEIALLPPVSGGHI
jgi:molybdopterin converting factor subunit 1